MKGFPMKPSEQYRQMYGAARAKLHKTAVTTGEQWDEVKKSAGCVWSDAAAAVARTYSALRSRPALPPVDQQPPPPRS